MDINPNSLEMIRRLSEAPGASGFEDAVLAVARDYAAGIGPVQEDFLRNLYLYRREHSGQHRAADRARRRPQPGQRRPAQADRRQQQSRQRQHGLYFLLHGSFHGVSPSPGRHTGPAPPA